jgi:hypothetical protein
VAKPMRTRATMPKKPAESPVSVESPVTAPPVRERDRIFEERE